MQNNLKLFLVAWVATLSVQKLTFNVEIVQIYFKYWIFVITLFMKGKNKQLWYMIVLFVLKAYFMLPNKAAQHNIYVLE